MRILVIEDEKKTAAFLAKGLREAGFVVDVAPDGEAGLAATRASKFDLLIVDIMLPKKDGWALVKELREAGVQTPVIFLTARDSVRDRVKGLELGADDYLVKPFAFSELLARLRSLLRRTPSASEDLRIQDLEIDTRRHRATLLLSCGLGVFYWIVVRYAFEEDSVVFADKVDTLQEDFEKRGGATAPAFEIDASRGSPFYVRVLDPSGATVRATPGMENLPPSVFPLAASREIAEPVEHRIGGHLYSLTSRHALGPDHNLPTVGNHFFTLQIAQDRSADEEFRKQFGALLILVLGAGVIASALIAITVTRRGLRPLAKMRRMFERVQPAHLNERIEPERWPTELRPLAASFDDIDRK